MKEAIKYLISELTKPLPDAKKASHPLLADPKRCILSDKRLLQAKVPTLLLKTLFTGACLLSMLLPLTVSANEQLMFSMGTTIENNSTNWAYIVWSATDQALLDGRTIALYRKEGGPTSGNPYTLAGVVTLQTDPRSLELLIQRAENLGDDPIVLGSIIDQMFDTVVPADTLDINEKLSAVIRGALGDSDLFDNLLFIGKAHPAVAMAIGRAYAGVIPAGKSTFELRNYDPDTGDAEEVLGRVTVEAGNPVQLPAPTDMTEVEDETPMGNLNVRLRWNAPDDLLRLGLLSFGYDIYRASEFEAVAKGYDVTPPAPEDLNSEYFTQVNEAPVLPDESNGDPDAWFFVDDNNAFDEGGTPLANGDTYYYFVAARDLLGRNGLVSEGVSVTICDRMPPRAPVGVEVTAAYNFSNNVGQYSFQITWDQNPDDPEDVTSGYYVYRGDSITNLQANASNESANLISGLIPHVYGAEKASYTDTNISAADMESTFWYMVRAVDDSVCSPNYSGQSGPTFGAGHDFESAAAPSNVSISIQQQIPSVIFLADDSVTPVDPTYRGFHQLVCHLTNLPSAVAWTEFSMHSNYNINAESATLIGERRYFPDGQDTISVDCRYGGPATFFCRVGTDNGTISEYAWHNTEAPDKGTFRRTTFEAHIDYPIITIDPDDTTIIVRPDDDVDLIIDWQWPTFTFVLPEGVEEYRLYRAVDGGEPDLFKDGLGDTNEVTEIVVEDMGAGIAYGATLCYYLQYFDKNGNPGPLTLIDCLEVQGEVPNPMMMGLEAEGSTDDPQMNIQWFCSPEGVERFNVWVSKDGDAPAGTPLEYCSNIGTNTYTVTLEDGTTESMNFAVFQTGRVGANFGSGTNPIFDVDAEISLGSTYTIFVRAIGTGNAESDDSDALQFVWSIPTEDTPEVPWPVRAINLVQTEKYDDRFVANYLAATSSVHVAVDCIGIRIGELFGSIRGKANDPYIVYELENPMTYMYTNCNPASAGDTMFPFVMYRQQITNSTFRHVSGDIYQVSPLMEEIAYHENTAATNTVIFDPYIEFYTESGWENFAVLYMLDTTPAVRGASYQYFLMRFDENHEIERIIPAGTVTVPQ